MVRILDLYSGVGGLSLGFALAIDGAEIVGLDIDRDAVETYNLNLNLNRFGARSYVQDVLVWEPVGDYDIVVGGSPCQPFSTANSRKPGDKHPLFTTFPRFFDVVLALKPKAFLLENVKVLTMNRYRHYLEQQVARVASDYIVEWRVLNAVNYGVPQRRERLIIIGVRKDIGAKPLFPEPTHGERESIRLDGRRIHRWVTMMEDIGDLLAELSSDELRLVLMSRGQVERIRRERENPLHRHWSKMEFPDRLDAPSRTISSHTIGGTKRETIVIPVVPYATGRADPATDLEGVYYRRLTVRECLRLQSFPDWWRFPDHVSISKRYKLVGEAVPPILAYRLALAIAKTLGLKTRIPPRKEEWQLPYFERAFADILLESRTQ